MLSIQVMHDTLFAFFFSPQVNLKSALNDSVKVARWMFCKLIPLWIVRNLWDTLRMKATKKKLATAKQQESAYRAGTLCVQLQEFQ